jgi:hypothetical protein
VVWHISHVGHTVQQISQLLEIPQKDTRRLLAAGRTAAAPAHPAAARATHDRPSTAASSTW